MKTTEFLMDKIPYILSHLTVILLTVSMLVALNPAGGVPFSLLAGSLYLAGAMAPLAMEFYRKRRFYDQVVRTYDQLDRKNLIAEMLRIPDFWEGILLYDLLRGTNKAYLDELSHLKNQQAEYREYIEQWVHEIKTPIASSKLTIQNNRSPATERIAEDLEAIESYVEQALYYARSNTVAKDYFIKEIRLEAPIYSVLKQDARQLIQAGMAVSAEDLDITVYTDSKWLEFILHQLIINAIKYAAASDPRLTLSAQEKDNCCHLLVADNGLGIPPNELSRIFDKGFTGTNGRLRGRSTGMGLYICHKLCGKLGIAISASSVYGHGTTICLTFPKSAMTHIL